jgi:photosystem II stability/assembly factor-like uncharacterized protein
VTLPRADEHTEVGSSGGAGYVTGRVVGLTGTGKVLFAAGAQGGVFRSMDGGNSWTPISDQTLTLASGDLRLAPDGSQEVASSGVGHRRTFGSGCLWWTARSVRSVVDDASQSELWTAK